MRQKTKKTSCAMQEVFLVLLTFYVKLSDV